MNKISFDNGMKSFTINDDENCVIRFNPSDLGIVSRFKDTKARIETISKKYDSLQNSNIDNAADILSECDKDMRDTINYILGNEVCSKAFGTTNVCSNAGGQPIALNFLEAVLPYIKQYVSEEAKKSEKNVNKYTSQIKHI